MRAKSEGAEIIDGGLGGPQETLKWGGSQAGPRPRHAWPGLPHIRHHTRQITQTNNTLLPLCRSTEIMYLHRGEIRPRLGEKGYIYTGPTCVIRAPFQNEATSGIAGTPSVCSVMII